MPGLARPFQSIFLRLAGRVRGHTRAKEDGIMDRYHCEDVDITAVHSANEATGFIPRPPKNKAELEAYEELLGIDLTGK